MVKIILVKQNFGSTKFGLKKVFGQKIFDPKKLWIQKFWDHTIVGKKNWVQQNFGSKKSKRMLTCKSIYLHSKKVKTKIDPPSMPPILPECRPHVLTLVKVSKNTQMNFPYHTESVSQHVDHFKQFFFFFEKKECRL